MPVEQTNSIGMKLVFIPPGEFEMGSTPEQVALASAEGKRYNENPGYMARAQAEAPRHRVQISQPFYLATYLVTQGEYQQVTGVNPSAFTTTPLAAAGFKPPPSQKQKKDREEGARKVAGQDTSRHPVETVEWDDAVEFCRRLSALPAERAARRTYRLPTEAEWEYACRCGTTTQRFWGDEAAGVQQYAWFAGNAGGMTHPVGLKKPNAWGLHDMYGNVWQMCSDWCRVDGSTQPPLRDSIGPAAGPAHVARGGCWFSFGSSCRSAYSRPAYRGAHDGFRVAAEVATQRQAGK